MFYQVAQASSTRSLTRFRTLASNCRPKHRCRVVIRQVTKPRLFAIRGSRGALSRILICPRFLHNAIAYETLSFWTCERTGVRGINFSGSSHSLPTIRAQPSSALSPLVQIPPLTRAPVHLLHRESRYSGASRRLPIGPSWGSFGKHGLSARKPCWWFSGEIGSERSFWPSLVQLSSCSLFPTRRTSSSRPRTSA